MKKFYKCGVIVFFIAVVTPLILPAQIFTTTIKPDQLGQKVWFHSQQVAERVNMPAIDFDALQAEDDRAASEGLPPRFGKALLVDLSPQNSGMWDSKSINLGRDLET